MRSTTFKIDGLHLHVRIDQDSPELFLGMLSMPFCEDLNLAQGEMVDVVEAGTCLLEEADGTRHLVRITSGQIQGPVRVMQVYAEISDEEILAEIRRTSDVGIQDRHRPSAQKADLGVASRCLFALLTFMIGAALIAYPFLFEMPKFYQTISYTLGGVNILAALLLFFDRGGIKESPAAA